MEKITHIQLVQKDNVFDVVGHSIAQQVKKYFQIDPGIVKTSKIFSVALNLSQEQIDQFANFALKDEILHDVYINNLYQNSLYKSYILISKLPGVTDDEGISAQKALCDLLNISVNITTQSIFSQDIFYLENILNKKILQQIAGQLLGNNLINHIEYGKFDGTIKYVPTVNLTTTETTETINIFISDKDLRKLSKDMLLSLDLNEMKAIQKYYQHAEVQKNRMDSGCPQLPTDCELEILAQTWS